MLVAGGNHDIRAEFRTTKMRKFIRPHICSPKVRPRPTVTSAPDVAELGRTIFVQTPDAASIAKALWVVPGSVTHAQNWTQRANVLDFTQVEGGLNITIARNRNEAPPGYYMMFLVNDQGVPSVAEWVRASPTVLAGDFNLDNVVDAADYTLWRDGLGTTYTPAELVWKANFGRDGRCGQRHVGAGTRRNSVLVSACFVRRSKRSRLPSRQSCADVTESAAAGRRCRRRGPCR